MEQIFLSLIESTKKPKSYIECYFNSIEGKEIKVYPVGLKFGGTFITCLKADTHEPLLIYRNRLRWRLIK